MIKKKTLSKAQVKPKVIPKVNIIKPLVVKPVVKPTLKVAAIKTPLKKIDAPIQKESALKVELKKRRLVEVTPEHDSYFVYLKNPLEYRRHLLEASRKILFCLKSHQKMFLIRQKKLEEMNKLKASVRELLYLNKKFNEKLPKYNTGFLEEMPSKDKSKPTIVKSVSARKPADPKQGRTEMDKLEESLANIEKKLKTLQ